MYMLTLENAVTYFELLMMLVEELPSVPSWEGISYDSFYENHYDYLWEMLNDTLNSKFKNQEEADEKLMEFKERFWIGLFEDLNIVQEKGSADSKRENLAEVSRAYMMLALSVDKKVPSTSIEENFYKECRKALGSIINLTEALSILVGKPDIS